MVGLGKIATMARPTIRPNRVWCAAEQRWYSVPAYRRKMFWRKVRMKLGLETEEG